MPPCACALPRAAGLVPTFTEAVPTLSKTVCRKSPAAYFASVSAKALARRVSPMAVFVSTIFRSICLHDHVRRHHQPLLSCM